jgi:ABC-type phosphate transport system substrate-binding protein
MGLYRATIIVCVAALGLLLASPAAAKDIAVISNKGNGLHALTLTDLSKICKGQSHRWPDGKEVVFIMRDPNSPEMKMVLQRIYGMSSEQVKSLIAAANQGHRDRTPILVTDSDESVLKAVRSMPGAIGVVDVYSINGSIDVLKIDGKVPLDPGYVLHGN